MSYVLKFVVVAAALAAAMPVGTAVAQGTITKGGGQVRMSPSANGSRSADGRRDSAPRNIYMVIQTDSLMSQQELASKFESARKSTQGCSFQSYDIDPIDPNTYMLLKSILQNGVVPPNAGSQGAVSIEPLAGQDGAWTVNLKSDSKYLESAKVKVATSAQGDEELTMKAEPKDKLNANLRYHSPGVYILKMPAGSAPKSATLMVSDEAKRGQSAPVAMEVIWPDAGRCYLATLKGVEGDEKELYDTLKDGKKIANPIKGIEDATKAAIVVASFKEVLAEPIVFKDDAIQLSFPKPGNVEPKRMWMRFPLTKTEEAAIRQELDAKFAGDGFKTVPAWIRQNQLGEKLTPEGSTGWFELPWNAEHQAFERTLPIDTKSWQERLVNNKEFMGDNAILIYEFEGEDESQEIIKIDGGKRYRPYQVAGWLTGLPSAPSAGKGGGK